MNYNDELIKALQDLHDKQISTFEIIKKAIATMNETLEIQQIAFEQLKDIHEDFEEIFNKF